VITNLYTLLDHDERKSGGGGTHNGWGWEYGVRCVLYIIMNESLSVIIYQSARRGGSEWKGNR